MKQADGWLLSAFSCRQAFILEVEVSPHTPEGAEALSPGQRPGLLRMIAYRPVR